MKQKEILTKLIDDYLENDKIDGAFYINGQWGIGKTKFILDYIDYRNSKVIKKVNKEVGCKNIYVSLNGIKSKEEISSIILAQIHPTLAKISNSSLAKIVKTIGKSLNFDLKIFSVDFEKISFDSLCKIDDGIILYFDDLERCLLNVCETLGYINQFVEQDKIKVIILGNDSEIKNYSDKDAIFKDKLIAALLSITETKNNIKINDYNSIENIKSVYEQKCDEVASKQYYEVIKEKVIWYEYNFYFEKEIVMEHIFQNDESNIYTEAKTLIEALIEYSQCVNIRTYKCAKSNIDYFYNNFAVKSNKEIRKYLICNIIWETIRCKNPNLLEESNFKNERVYFKYITKCDCLFYFFKSIHDFVFFGTLNESMLKKELSFLRNDLKNNKDANSVPILRDLNKKYWNQLDDVDLCTKITQMLNDTKEKKIPFKFYPVVLKNYYTFKDDYSEFENPKTSKEELKKIMISNINSCPSIIDDLNKNELFFEKGSIKEAYDEIFETINLHNREINSKVEISLIKNNISKLTTKDFDKMSISALNDKCFLSKFTMDELLEFIKDSSNEELVNFRVLLNTIYDRNNISLFRSDYDVICNIIDYLSKLCNEGNGIIRKKNLSLLKEMLEQYKIQITKINKAKFSIQGIV